MFDNFYTPQQLLNTYGYGCYCLNLGDRPLAGIMTGVYPVDAKDRHCFEFTRCNRCVTFDYGEACTPEQVAYDFEITEDNDVICTNSKGTCQHAICECDRHTILGFKRFIDIYSPEFHAINGFEMTKDCLVKPKDVHSGKKAKMDCCGIYPYRLPYNENEYICCDGRITPSNECEESSFN